MNKSQELLTKFTLIENDVPIITIGIQLLVVSTVPLGEAKGGYNKIYENVLRIFGRNFQLWRDNEMNHMEQFTAEKALFFSHWLSTASLQKSPLYGFHLQSHATEINPEPPIFDFFYDHLGLNSPKIGIRLMLPINEFGNNPDAIVHFVNEILNSLPVLYGFCGYAFCWNPEYPSVMERFREWAVPKLKRHPGLDHGDLLPYVLYAREGVLALNWLTFLGKGYTDALSGFEGIKSVIGNSSNISIYHFGVGGTLIRAGSAPALGDVNRQDLLPAYRHVGNLLSPLRISDDLLRHVNLMGMEGEEKQQWLKRFFTEKVD